MSVPPELVVGCRVQVPTKNLEGTVHFVGTTKFASGKWVGIELPVPKGRHDGTLKGEHYFTCPPLHGMFARVTQVKVIAPPEAAGDAGKATEKKAATSPTKKPKSTSSASSPTKLATKTSTTSKASTRTASSGSSTSSSSSSTSSSTASASAAEIKKLTAKINDLEEDLMLQKLETELAVEEKELLKEQLDDMEQAGGAAVGSGGGDSSEEVQQLKVAVVKLRDAYRYTKEELDIVKGDYRKASQELSAIKPVTSSGSSSGVDAAAMMEELVVKNNTLEAANQSLQDEIAELTELVKVNEELAEAYIKYEQESTSELDIATATIDEMQAVMTELQNQNREYQAAVPRMRKQIHKLTKELEEAVPAAGAALDSGSKVEDLQKISELNAKLTSYAKRERAAAVDRKLQNVEQKSTSEAVDLLRLFMPDAFFNTDYAGLQLVQFLQRLENKSEVVLADVTSQYKLESGISELTAPTEGSYTVDQLSDAFSVVSAVTSVRSATQKLLTGLSSANETTYKAISSKYPDFAPHEGGIDQLLELWRADELGDGEVVAKLRAAYRQIDGVATMQFAEAGAAEANTRESTKFARGELDAMHVYVSALAVELTRLREMLSRTTMDGEFDPAYEPLLARIEEWRGKCKEIERLTKNAIGALKSPDETKVLCLPSEARASLSLTTASIRDFGSRIRDTCAAVWSHTHSGPTLKAIQLDSAIKIAAKALVDLSEAGEFTARAVGANAEEGMIPLHAPVVVSTVVEYMTKLHHDLEHGALDIQASHVADESVKVVPWAARGTAHKTEIVESLNYKKQLEEKETELLEEKKKSARKTREISDLTVKNSNKTKEARTYREELDAQKSMQVGRVAELEAQLSEQAAGHDRVVDQLEEDNVDLAKQVKDLTKKYVGGRAGGLSGVADLRGARVEICSLKEALRIVQTEAAYLRGLELKRQLEALPTLPSQPTIGRSKPQDVVTNVHAVLRDLKMTAAAPVVVDVTKNSVIEGSSAGSPSKSVAKPAVQLARRAAQLHALCSKGSSAHASAASLFGASAPAGGKTNSDFGSFATPAFKRAMFESSNGFKAATIRLSGKGNSGKTCKLAVTPEQFRSIHAEFLR